MAQIQTIPAAPKGAIAASQYLTPIVLGLQALAVNGKQAHWNVQGKNFLAIHQLLDDVVGRAQTAADQAAERIVALGLSIDARVERLAEQTSTKVPAGFAQWEESVRALVADFAAVIADTQVAIDGLDGIDLPSQDVAIGIKEALDKDRWLLSANLAE